MKFEPRIASESDLRAKPGLLRNDYKALICAKRVTVVEINHTVQGLLVVIPKNGTMLLDNVAVTPSAQGLGLGRKLMAYAEQCARMAGCQLIRLYTNEAMVKNIEYYTRIRYVETHRAEEKGA
ncbi:acyl-CoA N-acyltransferase [Hypoxylon argillaceum]|nr:acyl-CoA N-acyltransferase [Hypoxylon argillaceum]